MVAETWKCARRRKYYIRHRRSLLKKARIRALKWHQARRTISRFTQRPCKWCREVLERSNYKHHFCSRFCRESWNIAHKISGFGQRYGNRPIGDAFVTFDDLAALLFVHRRTVYEWKRKGLPSWHDGCSRVIPLRLALDWLGARTKPAGKRKFIEHLFDDPNEAGVIYAWVDPRLPFPRGIKYIGKTRNFKKRVRDYKKAVHNARLRRWMKKLRQEGVEPEIKIIDTAENNLGKLEREWISGFRKEFGSRHLANVTDGGDGCAPLDRKARRIVSRKMKLMWKDKSFRDSMVIRILSGVAKKRGMTLDEYLRFREDEERGRKLRGEVYRQRLDEFRRRREAKSKLQLIPLTYKGTAFLPLRRGRRTAAFAKIDSEQFGRVSRWSWQLQIKRSGGKTYRRAKRSAGGGGIVLLNREICGMPKNPVRHLNGDQLDCRRSNLIESLKKVA